MEAHLPRVARQAAEEAHLESSQVNITWVSNGDRMRETKTMESKIKMSKCEIKYRKQLSIKSYSFLQSNPCYNSSEESKT